MQELTSETGRVETMVVEGARHIRLTGECDLQTVAAIQEHLNAALDGGERRIIFDLERVTFLDSSILRIFLVARRHTLADGGEVILLCRPGFVRRLLALLEMDRIVRVCTPEEWRERTAALN